MIETRDKVYITITFNDFSEGNLRDLRTSGLHLCANPKRLPSRGSFPLQERIVNFSNLAGDQRNPVLYDIKFLEARKKLDVSSAENYYK
ncbi:MAG: hypothetical protein ACLFWL_04310 [Candidatus Brocadiia bacterium]